jgi:hypothetical protein
MRLIEDLERALAGEDSLFRAQLLREDIARLKKLRELANGTSDPAAFKQAGMRIGWTPGDARTAELREPLEKLLDEIYALERGNTGGQIDARVTQAWNALHRVRMERLLGCLSTPVPKPSD